VLLLLELLLSLELLTLLEGLDLFSQPGGSAHFVDPRADADEESGGDESFSWRGH
jgi:hypothetical protein